jgi:hypothetical protein
MNEAKGPASLLLPRSSLARVWLSPSFDTRCDGSMGLVGSLDVRCRKRKRREEFAERHNHPAFHFFSDL